MKNYLILSLFLMFALNPIYANNNGLYVPNGSYVNIQYQQKDESNLINFHKMNKKEKVEKANNELKEKPAQSLKLDTREIIHQKALDYTTRQTSSIPIL